VSEGQTWSSEDTRLLVSKSFLAPARSSICLPSLRSALTAAAFSEAERIVFAAEGLFLAHDFPFNCGIRVEPPMIDVPYAYGLTVKIRNDWRSKKSNSCCNE
jgi:hypothetical protein